MKNLLKTVLVGAVAAIALHGPAMASDFYKGKTLTYIVATSPGGGYDTYARLIAKYMKKYLGVDRIVVRNIPGAGHIVGTNTLYKSAPDGLTIGTFNTGLIVAQILGQDGIQFDLNKMSWIGKAASDPRAMVVSGKSGINSVADIRARKQVLFAGAGVGSSSYIDTKMISVALDLPIKIVTGFNGDEGEMAMMRGEVAGQVGSLSSLEPYVKNNGGKIIMAVGAKPGAPYPTGKSLADTKNGKALMALIAANSTLGRLTAAPPNTDPARLKDLRDAYAKALADPDLLAEAKKMGRPIDPAGGEEVASLVKEALDQSPETVAVIKAAVEAEAPTVTAKSKLLTVTPDGKHISFNSSGKVVKAKISGSRTSVKIDGKAGKRADLTKGMQCTIVYDPKAENNEPKLVDCQAN